MAICRDCVFHDAIDSKKGKCKCKRIERHVGLVDGEHEHIINGWPVVDGDELVCGDSA